MPRVKLERLVDSKPQSPVNTPEKVEPEVVDLAPAIEVALNFPVNHSISVRKKLAGTPFVVDVETGVVYLEEKILKALKNN